MAQIMDKRVTAEIEGAFVVFLIGMRTNKFWKTWKWLPIFFAMPRMLRELEQRPEAGLLGASGYFGSPRRPMLVQFWRSFEHLEAHARSRDAAHNPCQQAPPGIVVRLRTAEAASARYGWALHVIENAGDDPPLEQPQAFLRALRSTLGSPSEVAA